MSHAPQPKTHRCELCAPQAALRNERGIWTRRRSSRCTRLLLLLPPLLHCGHNCRQNTPRVPR